jgi:hypothetical protein
MRSGVEIWVEKEKAQKLIDLMGTTESKFVDIDGEMINSASVEGIFSPKTMQDLWYRKNGYWQCDKANYWHKRGEQCGH